ncbi:MAG: GntR family transcriptional regulator [Pseudomonadota bacterium]
MLCEDVVIARETEKPGKLKESNSQKQAGARESAGDSEDRKGPATLHAKIRETIQSSISDGAYPPGSLLPGELDLAEKFDVSRITIKRALNDLALAGQVRRVRGRGTIVTGGPNAPVVRGSFSNFIETLRKIGLETEVELLSVQREKPPAAIADALQVPETEMVERAIRLRRLDHEPFSYLVTYVPLDIADRYSDDELAKTPLLSLLDRSGVEPTSAEQTLTAVAADETVAAALEAPVGSPLFKIFRIMMDKDGRPVQAIEAHYLPQKFQYQMKLTRRRDTDGSDHWSDS